jgi:hypothetical protein
LEAVSVSRRLMSRVWARRLPVLGLALMVVPLLSIGVASVPAHTMDATGPLTVLGHVYDYYGLPLSGATVVATILETSFSTSGVTDGNGAYQCTPDIPANKYDEGYTLRVVATYASLPDQNQTQITAEMNSTGIAEIDVHYTYEIPEFGPILGVGIAGMVVAVVSIFSLTRRQNARK